MSETTQECRERPYPGNDLHDGDSNAAQPKPEGERVSKQSDDRANKEETDMNK